MKEIGVLQGYSLTPDKNVGGNHICRLTLIIKTGPLGLPWLARDCGDLLGEQIAINLTAIQTPIDVGTGEVV